MLEVSPCLTRSHYRGHWITNKNRRLTLKEMMRLQGMNPENITIKGTPTQQGQQLGNAMSVNVIQRVIQSSLKAAD